VLYQSENNVSQALEAMRPLVRSEQGKHLVAFIEARTGRGIVR
jgi:hypothetical protein